MVARRLSYTRRIPPGCRTSTTIGLDTRSHSHTVDIGRSLDLVCLAGLARRTLGFQSIIGSRRFAILVRTQAIDVCRTSGAWRSPTHVPRGYRRSQAFHEKRYRQLQDLARALDFVGSKDFVRLQGFAQNWISTFDESRIHTLSGLRRSLLNLLQEYRNAGCRINRLCLELKIVIRRLSFVRWTSRFRDAHRTSLAGPRTELDIVSRRLFVRFEDLDLTSTLEGLRPVAGH
jgi:hypothetical protein